MLVCRDWYDIACYRRTLCTDIDFSNQSPSKRRWINALVKRSGAASLTCCCIKFPTHVVKHINRHGRRFCRIELEAPDADGFSALLGYDISRACFP